MAYKVPESDIADYYRQGYIVFRQLLPTTLIRDLRRECDKGAAAVRETKGADAQRFQPVGAFDGKIDLKPFRDYAELPELREALDQVLTPKHFCGRLDVMGVLIEPTDMPWCTAWHRDMTLESSRLPEVEFHDIMLDWNSANQVNCALYADDSTWFVPGSHLRARNMPGEWEAANRHPSKGWKPYDDVKDFAERERLCADYTRGMPGAVQLRLEAGDYAMYRPLGWHIGNYLPYRRRATLHDAVFTPQYEVWWRQWIKGGSPRWTRETSGQPVATK